MQSKSKVRFRLKIFVLKLQEEAEPLSFHSILPKKLCLSLMHSMIGKHNCVPTTCIRVLEKLNLKVLVFLLKITRGNYRTATKILLCYILYTICSNNRSLLLSVINLKNSNLFICGTKLICNYAIMMPNMIIRSLEVK